MSRRDIDLLQDIAIALAAIKRHRRHGSIDDEIVVDAVTMRLIQIGEAVKGLSDDVKALAPEIQWRQIAGMRDRLTHRYFENETSIIKSTLDNDLVNLAEAVGRLTSQLKT